MSPCLNVLAPWNSLSYGIVSKNIIKELHRRGVDIALFPIGQLQVESQEEAIVLQEIINNQGNFYYHAPSLRIFHQFSMAEHVGKLKIGYPIFELDTFTEREIRHVSYLDYVFVTSKWAKEIVVQNCKIPENLVVIVNLGVDRNIFYPPTKENDGPYRFYVAGKWEHRKNQILAAEAFLKAFPNKSDDVELWMMCHNPFLKPEDAKVWEQQVAHPKIKLIPPVPTHAEVGNIIRKIDCGVFVSHAEGWDFPCMEVLSTGGQVIVSDYSAHTEYCTKENSYLINIDKLEPAFDGIWFHGQGNWASIDEPQFDQLVEYMRAVYKKGRVVNQAGIETAKKFSWKNTVDKMLPVLS